MCAACSDTMYRMQFIELCVDEIKEKVYFKFHKVHFRANSALLLTKSCNKALFVVQLSPVSHVL